MSLKLQVKISYFTYLHNIKISIAPGVVDELLHHVEDLVELRGLLGELVEALPGDPEGGHGHGEGHDQHRHHLRRLTVIVTLLTSPVASPGSSARARPRCCAPASPTQTCRPRTPASAWPPPKHETRT